MAIDKAYVSGVLFGVTNKITKRLNRNMFTPQQHELAQKTVGQLYDCRPVDSVFSKEGVAKLQEILVEFGTWQEKKLRFRINHGVLPMLLVRSIVLHPVCHQSFMNLQPLMSMGVLYTQY